MAFGVIAFAAGFLSASRCDTFYGMLASFVCAGIGFGASFYVPSSVVVTSWMQEKKSLGMGIVWGAASVGAAVCSPLIGWCIEAYGWRVASAAIAGLTAMMLPVALLGIRTRPRSITKTLYCALDQPKPLLAQKKLLLSTAFIVATTSSALFGIGMLGIYYHVVPVLIKAGYPTHMASLVLGVSWVVSAFGSLLLGAVAERLGAKAVLAGALVSCALGTLFLLGAGEATIGITCVVAFVALWGMSANSVSQFIPVIFAERFGSSRLGTLVGVQSSVMGIAGAAAPIVTGLLFDKFSDYRVSIYLSACAMFLAFVAVLFVRAPNRAKSLLEQGADACR
jgi:predicted MFS family arabinose efflux permease